MTLPTMPPNQCLEGIDRESLAVGTQLLVFTKGVLFNNIVLKYSILTNTWSTGVAMNSSRYMFGSASFGERAIVAGGTSDSGSILDSAELYNSETQTWTTLPSMNIARRNCSGVFMDGKFYVIGGIGSNNELLACGEEYDLKEETWTIKPNMSPGLHGPSGAPPLLAVVNNELYAANCAEKTLRKYDKSNNTWITLGRLPERSDSVDGWGIAFRACGERLLVIGGPRSPTGRMIELEVNSWIPEEEVPPNWNIIARKRSSGFVYNCAVMGC